MVKGEQLGGPQITYPQGAECQCACKDDQPTAQLPCHYQGEEYSLVCLGAWLETEYSA